MEDKDGKRTLTCNSQGMCHVQDHIHFDEIKTRIFFTHHSILKRKWLTVVYYFAEIQDKAQNFRKCLFKKTLKNYFHC